MTFTLLCCLVYEILTPRKLLPSPKEALADPLPNICSLVGGVRIYNCYQVLEGGCS